ncbi:hypothetical protein ACNKHT_15415 [Shigella flexneri]
MAASTEETVFNFSGAGAPSPTNLLHHARYDKLIDAFRRVGYNVTTTDELRHALTTGIQSRKPTIINVVIDPAAGTEDGHITKLNPKQVAGNKILTSSPLANSLCDGEGPLLEILYANIFIGNLIPIIVIMLLGYSSGRRETFSEN